MVAECFPNVKTPCGCFVNKGPLPTKTIFWDSRYHNLENEMIREDKKRVFQVLVVCHTGELVWINIHRHDVCSWDEWDLHYEFLKRKNLLPGKPINAGINARSST